MAARRERKFCVYCLELCRPQIGHSTEECKCDIYGRLQENHYKPCKREYKNSMQSAREQKSLRLTYLTNTIMAENRYPTYDLRRPDSKLQLRPIVKPKCQECAEEHCIKEHLCRICWMTGHGESAHNCIYCVLPHKTKDHECRLCFDSKYRGHSDHRIDEGIYNALVKITLEREKIIPPLIAIIFSYSGKHSVHETCDWCGRLYYWERRSEHQGLRCEKCIGCGHKASNCDAYSFPSLTPDPSTLD